MLLALLLGVRTFLSVTSADGQFWDFHNFYNAGLRIYHGNWSELYRPAVPVREVPMYYVGFPLSAWYLAPFGAFSGGIAVRAFKLSCAICLALGAGVLYGPFRHAVRGRIAAAWVMPAYLTGLLLFEPLWFTFPIGGQSTAHAFPFVALFFVAFRAERDGWAALWLALAILIKPFLVLATPLLLALGYWRLLVRVAAIGGAAALLSVAIFGVGLHREWVEIVRQEGERWASPWTKNASLIGIASNWWVHVENMGVGVQPMPPALARIAVGIKLAVLGGFAWLTLRVWRTELTSAARRDQAVLLALSFPLFFSTIVWAHYFQFLAIPILVMIPLIARGPRGAMILFWLMLAATLRANWQPLSAWLNRAVEVHTPVAWALASLYSAGVLLCLAMVLALHHGAWLRSATHITDVNENAI
ncbi:MAG: glycosyltransferase 87 family protein [Phycisphaerae bacterium]